MRVRREPVARRACVDHRNVAPSARQIGRGGQPGKTAADDDRIMFHVECSGSWEWL
jgi:hypothetical protein